LIEQRVQRIRTDELYLKIKGDMKYLYPCMDVETRFWIAQQVADTKYTANTHTSKPWKLEGELSSDDD
jgi:transposase-like protein